MNPDIVHQFDQATAALRDVAELLGRFREYLLDEGFSEEGAEHITESFSMILAST